MCPDSHNFDYEPSSHLLSVHLLAENLGQFQSQLCIFITLLCIISLWVWRVSRHIPSKSMAKLDKVARRERIATIEAVGATWRP